MAEEEVTPSVSDGTRLEGAQEEKETVDEGEKEEQVKKERKPRRIAIDYIIAKNYDNEYIQSWLALPFVHAIKGDPNFHSFLNHNELKKEMTESYAVFVRVQQIIRRLYHNAFNNSSNFNSDPSSASLTNSNSNSNSPNINTTITVNCETSTCTSLHPPNTSNMQPISLEEFTEGIVLFDVCSGKGYSATLLSCIFPKLKIFMIDKDTKMNLQHLKSLPNVQMVHFDLFKKDKVSDWVVQQTKNKIGLFLGTHLCGELSEMFVDIYNAVAELRGLVLAPCCLSKRKRIFADTAAKLKVDNYEYWTMHLYWMIQHSKKNLNADENVFSVKNNYISAIKCT